MDRAHDQPHVPAAQWREQLLLELRLLDVPGPRIGDALAEVDAHCTDPGTTPAEAFGAPREYAATLTGALPPPVDHLGGGRAALIAGGAVVGVLALLGGVGGLVGDGRATVTAGDVSLVVLLMLGAVLLQRVLPVLVRPGRLVLKLVVSALVGSALLVLVVLWADVVARPPAWLALAVGALAMVAVVAHVAGSSDPVRDPRTGRAAVPTPRRLTALVIALPLLMLALWAALLLGT